MRDSTLEELFEEYNFILIDTSFLTPPKVEPHLPQKIFLTNAIENLAYYQDGLEDTTAYIQTLASYSSTHQNSFLTPGVIREIIQFQQLIKRAARNYQLALQTRIFGKPLSKKYPFIESSQIQSLQSLSQTLFLFVKSNGTYRKTQIPLLTESPSPVSPTDAHLVHTLLDYLTEHPDQNGAVLTRDRHIKPYLQSRLRDILPLPERENLTLRSEVVYKDFTSESYYQRIATRR